jgi:hypothetical protein
MIGAGLNTHYYKTFSPTDIGGCVLHLSNHVGVDAIDNDVVERWVDISPSGNHAYGITNGGGDTFTITSADGTAPGWDSNDVTVGATFIASTNVLELKDTIILNEFTIFTVHDITADTSKDNNLTLCGRFPSDFITLRKGDDIDRVQMKFEGELTTNMSNLTANLDLGKTRFAVRRQSGTSANVQVFQGGSEITDTAADDSTTATKEFRVKYIGARLDAEDGDVTHPFNGQFYEIIIFNKALSDAELAEVDVYLKEKHNM